jgi:hypothetical protein
MNKPLTFLSIVGGSVYGDDWVGGLNKKGKVSQ